MASSTNHGDSQTITSVVTVQVKRECEAEFLALSGKLIAQVHAHEPNVLVYALTKDPTRESTYVWIERYRDRAAQTAP